MFKKCNFFISLNFKKPQMFFLKARILYLDEKKNRENHEKIMTERSGFKTERFYIKLYMSPCTKEKSSHPPQVFLSEI